MKKLMMGVLTVGLTMVAVGPATAAVLVDEDFDGYSDGVSVTTYATWNTSTGWPGDGRPLVVKAAAAHGGTGNGLAHVGVNDENGAWVSFAPVTKDDAANIVRVSFDAYIDTHGNTSQKDLYVVLAEGEPFWNPTDTRTRLSFNQPSGATSPRVQLGETKVDPHGSLVGWMLTENVADATWVHVTAELDLRKQFLSVDHDNDADGPTRTALTGLDDFEPATLILYTYGGYSSSTIYVDNIRVEAVEPSQNPVRVDEDFDDYSDGAAIIGKGDWTANGWTAGSPYVSSAAGKSGNGLTFNPGDAEVVADIQFTPIVAPDPVRVSFDVYIDSTHASQKDIAVLLSEADPFWGPPWSSLRLLTSQPDAVNPLGVSLGRTYVDGSQLSPHLLVENVASATWVHISAELDLVNQTVTVDHDDDADGPTVSGTLATLENFAPEFCTIYIYTGNTGAPVYLDNLRVETDADPEQGTLIVIR